MQRQKMPWIGHNPSMRIIRIRTFCVRALVLATLGALGLAGTAYADETPEAAGPAAAEQEAVAGTEPPPPEEPEAKVPPPEEPKEVPPPEEVKAEVPPPEEVKAEVPPPEEAKETAPPPGESMPTITGLGEEEAPKAAHTGQGSEEGGSAASRSSLGADSTISPTSPLRTAATEESPAALLALVTSPPTAGDPEAQVSAGSAVDAVGATAAMRAAQRARALRCGLVALGGQTSDSCTVGWLDGKRVLAPSVTLTRSVSLLSTAATGFSRDDGGGGPGGSAVGNSPVSPAPGPAPGGASGAAVGGGAPGGAAISIFLTLAGLLLLAGPRAMRRLRLSCEPWLTACFVLIPERPG
jgi:outer membrane biosynthesis protein TonB